MTDTSTVLPGLDLSRPGLTLLTKAPEGFDALVLADCARLAARTGKSMLHIARNDQRMAALSTALGFYAPDIALVRLPAWDCLPYDRVSPSNAITSERLAAMARLAANTENQKPGIVLTTLNAALQRMPARETIAGMHWSLAPGNRVDMAALTVWLAEHGFERMASVRDASSFAVRGGIIDLFPPSLDMPVRLDFFGDTLESIRSFDAETQRTVAQLKRLDILPVSEVLLSEEGVRRFRAGYLAAFGAVTGDDPVYEAVSERRRAPGMEHWLPLYHERLETVFDYVPGAAISLDDQVQEARQARLEQIGEFYDARREGLESNNHGAPAYRPLAPDALYLTQDEWDRCAGERALLQFTPFGVPEKPGARIIAFDAQAGRNFAPERADGDVNVFDVAITHVSALQRAGKRVVIACWSAGSRERLGQLLGDHGLQSGIPVTDWAQAQSLPVGQTALAVLGLEHGFETGALAIICEQDILGDRLVRQSRRGKRAADFLTEATSLGQDDIVVHVDHGIGRFTGLRTIEAAGAPHDCLELVYAGGDRLFVPVENIELLSRYGAEDANVQLDRLGGVGWQTRKARLKQRIREIAGELLKVAAARHLRQAPVIVPPEGLYDEFCARFAFQETEDQLGAIDAVMEDLASGRPMDRLICGDVGFGKTEVALRSAFVTAMAGHQVAIVVPTTLLARQHYATFVERFKGLPVRVAQASRLVSAKELKDTREGLASGDVDIVIGTHALLGKQIRFRDLGLLIVDEEQHFGVTHKERLKQFRAEVHVLTLTATPIPRTLQLALSGVRELSIIATPPVDRLAVRTFISPFDPVTVREALLRERYRGGQSFYVCPRIADMPEAQEFLAGHVPELKVAVAHGQMPPQQLDDIMTAFYDGRYDVLLSTAIVESGLDVPAANTLIVHRADMFGLAQLYQLRGRVGRSKVRAYALLTLPPRRKLTHGADKRLKVLQSLDTLGAGFMLASHDLDIRGAGNLLGDEQSGHIKEVGFELYQSMLEQTIAELRDTEGAGDADQWSPQISVGAAIIIPESYVADLELRLGLYRRLAGLTDKEDLDSFAAELSDRFGPLPGEVNQLLRVVGIKVLCRRAGIAKLEAGPNGALLAFRNDQFANPEGLIQMISKEGAYARLRPDHRLVLKRNWKGVEDNLKGAEHIAGTLAAIAARATV